MAFRNYTDLMEIADSLYHFGLSTDNKEAIEMGRILKIRGEISGHAGLSHKEEMGKLTEKMLKEDSIIVYNDLTYHTLYTLALYYLYEDLDYSKAADAAYKALESAEAIGQKSFQADALGTLTAIYVLKGDSAGWEYAKKCEEIAKDVNNHSARYVAYINMANFMYNQGKFKETLKYLLEAKDLIDKNHIVSEKSYADCFLADVYSKLGDKKKAKKYYELSLQPNDATSFYDFGYAKMRYASFLEEQKKYKEALAQLKEVEGNINKNNRPNYYLHLLMQIAEVLEAMDMDKDAIDYYKRYMELKDQQITAEKEKAINVVELKYKVAVAENINMQQSLEMIKKEKKLWIMTGISMIFIITAGLLLILYRRRNKYFKAVVKAKLDALEKQKELQHQLNELMERKESNGLSISEDMASDLYKRLTLLMTNDEVYCQQDLSLDKLATMLETNRTYLSHVIKTKANTTYSSYINEFRLNHTIGLLSDPDNTDSLKMIAFKSGFSTVANFYHLFKQKVGMSPAIFRENAQGTKI